MPMAWALWDSCGKMRRTEGSVEDMAEKCALQRIVCQGERSIGRVFSRRRYSSVEIVTSWDVGPQSGDPPGASVCCRGKVHCTAPARCNVERPRKRLRIRKQRRSRVDKQTADQTKSDYDQINHLGRSWRRQFCRLWCIAKSTL